MTQEIWATVKDFPNYQVSNHGRIYNIKHDRFLKIGLNNFGHTKVALASEWDGLRYTRSFAKIVAEAFVERPTPLCDQVIVLDGDYTRIIPENLAWRPARFAWKYAHQLKEPNPSHYRSRRVRNMTSGVVYGSIIEAGISEGLLFEDVFKSTNSGKPVFPYQEAFEIV